MSMENHPPCGQCVSQDANSLQDFQLPESQKQSCGAAGDGLVNDLENTICKAFHIQDAEESECTSDEDGISNIEGNASEEPKIHENKSEQKCLSKCATFPCSSEMLSPAASSDEEKNDIEAASLKMFPEKPKHSAYSRSISLPIPLKLVPAMKGSREKQGVSPGKLTVTWAPDVYDPPPSSLSRSVGKKPQKSKKNDYKKNGKNKQKGSSARGSSGKDKKQYRKIGSASKYYKTLDARDRAFSNDYIDDKGLVGYDVGSPDSYCGSSFLEKSLTKMHYSVAEAL